MTEHELKTELLQNAHRCQYLLDELVKQGMMRQVDVEKAVSLCKQFREEVENMLKNSFSGDWWGF
jgi:hypothetical protein